MKIVFHLLLFLVPIILQGQISKEEIYFESANPFSLSDIIGNLNNQEKQNNFLKDIELNLSKINVDEIFMKWHKLGSKNNDINNRFEKIINKILQDSGLSSEDSKIKLFEFKTQVMDDNEKNKKIINLNKQLEVLNKEVSTLENNLSFFNEKSKENKLLNKFHKDIEKNKKLIENIIFQIKLLKN